MLLNVKGFWPRYAICVVSDISRSTMLQIMAFGNKFLAGGKHYPKITIPVFRVVLQKLALPDCFPYTLFYRYLLALLCTPQRESGSRGIVVACRAGGRAGVTSHRYRSPGRSSYRSAVKLGGDESWCRISDEFVHGKRGSLIKRLTS